MNVHPQHDDVQDIVTHYVQSETRYQEGGPEGEPSEAAAYPKCNASCPLCL